METQSNILEQFNNMQKLPLFEIEAVNKKSKEVDYVIFDIFIENGNLIAQHVGLTFEEEASNKIAFQKVEIDEDFDLDENLQNLFEECNEAILQSDFYSLS